MHFKSRLIHYGAFFFVFRIWKISSKLEMWSNFAVETARMRCETLTITGSDHKSNAAVPGSYLKLPILVFEELSPTLIKLNR